MIWEEYYLEGHQECWECGKKTRVYTWMNHNTWSENRPMVDPLPDTVKFLYSHELQDSYWGNVCEHCEATQGDWFIYHSNEGAFSDPYAIFDVRPKWFDQVENWEGWSRP